MMRCNFGYDFVSQFIKFGPADKTIFNLQNRPDISRAVERGCNHFVMPRGARSDVLATNARAAGADYELRNARRVIALRQIAERSSHLSELPRAMFGGKRIKNHTAANCHLRGARAHDETIPGDANDRSFEAELREAFAAGRNFTRLFKHAHTREHFCCAKVNPHTLTRAQPARRAVE